MNRTNTTMTLLTFLLGVSSVNANAEAFTFNTLNNNADPTFNQLLGINDAGTIAGYFGSGLTGHPNQGYTLGQGGYIPENFPGSVQTQVTGINNHGLTVGFWADQNNNNFGFVDNHGVFTNVVNPSTGASGGQINQLLAVSDNNIAAGFYVDTKGNTVGETYNIATNSFHNLDINGSTVVQATAINNANMVGGFYVDNNGKTDGFILDANNKLVTLMAPGEMSTQVLGLNNNGLVDGVVMDGNEKSHGFIYNINTQQYTIVDDPNGLGTTTFNGINDKGQVTGFYVDAAGNTDGLLANPVPEPSILALIAAGVLGLMSSSRRRYASKLNFG